MPIASWRPYHWYDPSNIKLVNPYKKESEQPEPTASIQRITKTIEVNKAEHQEDDFIAALFLLTD